MPIIGLISNMAIGNQNITNTFEPDNEIIIINIKKRHVKINAVFDVLPNHFINLCFCPQ